MRKIFTILFLSICFVTSSQNPQLTENEWFLQKLTIDNTDIVTPEELQNTTLFMDNTVINVETSICQEYLQGLIDMYISDDQFTLMDDGGTVLLGICGGDNFQFVQAHNSIYYNTNVSPSLAKNDFSYAIFSENDILFLEINNGEGNSATYSNEILSLNSNSISKSSLTPNPAVNSITINSNNNILNYGIYTITGKLISSKNIDTTKTFSINIEQLLGGFYFLKLITNNHQIETLKFLKY